MGKFSQLSDTRTAEQGVSLALASIGKSARKRRERKGISYSFHHTLPPSSPNSRVDSRVSYEDLLL